MTSSRPDKQLPRQCYSSEVMANSEVDDRELFVDYPVRCLIEAYALSLFLLSS